MNCECNCKSWLLTVLVVMAVVFGTDFLIHGMWLAPVYKATAELWRPEAEMGQKFPFMLLGQFLVAFSFSTIFALFVANYRSLTTSLLFGGLAGIFAGATQVIMYAVQPYPGSLVVKWFLVGIVQMIVIATVAHLVYRPNPKTV
jgi:hypothetical protein